MKRNKHITVNFTEDQYKIIDYLSRKTKRKMADYLFILIDDVIHQKIIAATDIKTSIIKQKIENEIIL